MQSQGLNRVIEGRKFPLLDVCQIGRAPATRAAARQPGHRRRQFRSLHRPRPCLYILQTDQRGLPRYADGNQDGFAFCDIGAFELQLEVWLPLLMR